MNFTLLSVPQFFILIGVTLSDRMEEHGWKLHFKGRVGIESVKMKYQKSELSLSKGSLDKSNCFLGAWRERWHVS